MRGRDDCRIALGRCLVGCATHFLATAPAMEGLCERSAGESDRWEEPRAEDSTREAGGPLEDSGRSRFAFLG